MTIRTVLRWDEVEDLCQAGQAAKMITNGAIEFSFPYRHTLDRDL
jgi:hypothetical protein